MASSSEGQVRVRFVRHSKAEGPTESARRVTEVGRQIALARREKFGGDYTPDLIIVSHLVRNQETAALLAGVESIFTGPAHVVVTPKLFTPEGPDEGSRRIKKAVDEMYEELKHVPFRTCLEHRNSAELLDFGTAGSLLLSDLMATFRPKEVLFVGHGGGLLPAIGYQGIPRDDPLEQVLLNQGVIGECQGFEFIFDEDRTVLQEVNLIE